MAEEIVNKTVRKNVGKRKEIGVAISLKINDTIKIKRKDWIGIGLKLKIGRDDETVDWDQLTTLIDEEEWTCCRNRFHRDYSTAEVKFVDGCDASPCVVISVFGISVALNPLLIELRWPQCRPEETRPRLTILHPPPWKLQQQQKWHQHFTFN